MHLEKVYNAVYCHVYIQNVKEIFLNSKSVKLDQLILQEKCDYYSWLRGFLNRNLNECSARKSPWTTKFCHTVSKLMDQINNEALRILNIWYCDHGTLLSPSNSTEAISIKETKGTTLGLHVKSSKYQVILQTIVGTTYLPAAMELVSRFGIKLLGEHILVSNEKSGRSSILAFIVSISPLRLCKNLAMIWLIFRCHCFVLFPAKSIFF